MSAELTQADDQFEVPDVLTKTVWARHRHGKLPIFLPRYLCRASWLNIETARTNV